MATAIEKTVQNASRNDRITLYRTRLAMPVDEPPEGPIHEIKHMAIAEVRVRHLAGSKTLRHATVRELVS